MRTYIASGNVVAERDGAEAEAKVALEAELRAYAGRSVGVIVRTAAEMAEVVANPLPDRSASRTVAIFLDNAPPPDALKDVKGQTNEELRGKRARYYVHYPDGIGRSKVHSRRRRRDRAQHEHGPRQASHGGRMRTSPLGLSANFVGRQAIDPNSDRRVVVERHRVYTDIAALFYVCSMMDMSVST